MRSLLTTLGLALTLSAQLVAQNAVPATDSNVAAAKAFVGALAREEFDVAAARFDMTMKAALTIDRLHAYWAQVITQAGAFKRIISTKTEMRGPYQVVSTTCEFERLALDVVTTFNPASEISGLAFPPSSAVPVAFATAPPYSAPAYANVSAYAESDVTIGAGGPWALPGTLTMPVGAGPFPAVVLVHGSGPGDRDETVGPNKPFKDLALGLASRGIAVVRYDKRTRVYPEKSATIPGLTVKDETIDDALVAVALLRATPRIDGARIFVVGHSLGGMLVPRIALADPKIRGLVVMAGNTRSVDQALVEQTVYIAKLDGRVTPEEQTQIDTSQKVRDAVRALTPADAARRDLVAGAPPSYWLDLRGYDPAATARSVTQPLLVLQGERDYQVTLDEFAQWKAALAGRTTATFHSYPALNHLFIAGTGAAGPDEYVKPGHVAPEVIGDIAGWIAQR